MLRGFFMYCWLVYQLYRTTTQALTRPSIHTLQCYLKILSIKGFTSSLLRGKKNACSIVISKSIPTFIQITKFLQLSNKASKICIPRLPWFRIRPFSDLIQSNWKRGVSTSTALCFWLEVHAYEMFSTYMLYILKCFRNQSELFIFYLCRHANVRAFMYLLKIYYATSKNKSRAYFFL